MKKFALGLTACVLSVALLGCSTSQNAITESLDSKMNDLHSTISSIKTISASDLSLKSSTEDNKAEHETQETAAQGYIGGPYGNVNTYAFPLMGYYGYGMYPGFNPYGYGLQGVNNMAGYKNFYMPYGQMPYGMYGYGSNNAGRWASNIDTYRINSVTENGETTTTVDSYHNGKHTGQESYTEPVAEENSDKTNLETTCQICLISNAYGDDLKNEILENINYVKELSNSIKSLELEVTKNQAKSVNELLDNITSSQSKINMSKGEMHKNLKNVMSHKAIADTEPNRVNAKYIKLLSTMDTRNTHLKNILASLIEMENCIDGNCGFNFNQNLKNSNWISSCPSGECSNCTNCTTCELCQNCQSCTTSSGCSGCINCNNCLLCTDCEACTNCFNCKDCVNCTNIANATGWVNNKPCENCITPEHEHTVMPQDNNTSANTQDEIQNQDNTATTQENNTENQEGGVTTSLPQTPSTGSVRVPNNIQGEIKPNVQETSINADKVIEDNLLEEGEFLAEDTDMGNNNSEMNNDQSFTTENGDNIEPKTLEEDSVFNENPNENNKALTA